jgi:hypothetical protein
MKTTVVAAVATGLALLFSSAADSQTVHRHHLQPAAEGRQITVYGRESYLTLGTGASPGDFNSYALSTISNTTYMPNIDHTTVGLRGQTRLPNNFTVPGCCLP